MARVKRGTTRARKRNTLFKKVKGYYQGRKNIVRHARTAVLKSGQRAYDHRKLKKRTRRALWNVKISAGAKIEGTTYSKLIGAMKKHNVIVDRKVLSSLAEHYPAVFAKIVSEVMKESSK